ncbi:hypothetical protein [Streptomyces sp. NPDC088725]|uniref:hypothetical protein n=1 Tax=Streptomyces sp. NPDC088725 TaxID=3365873 RepID=UPI00382D0F82
MVAFFGEAYVVEDDDAVGAQGGAEAVCDEDDGAAGAQGADALVDGFLGERVERRSGFVANGYRGVAPAQVCTSP